MKLKISIYLKVFLLGILLASCTPQEKDIPKISLAQWSMHQQLFDGSADPKDFAKDAKEKYGIQAIEYVSAFYKDQATDESFWKDMKERSDQYEVKNIMIMVDGEGDLGAEDEQERLQAVMNHHKWIKAASILECQSIRVNAFGSSNYEVFKESMIKSLTELGETASLYNLNIIIENHGSFSSEADKIVDIISQVGLPNVGTLPDFGNWCYSKQWGGVDGACEASYDLYQGVEEFMPFAKSVSAKTYDFNEDGTPEFIDFKKMMAIVKNAGFKGYIGIEYEGKNLSEDDGIKATKEIILKSW